MKGLVFHKSYIPCNMLFFFFVWLDGNICNPFLLMNSLKKCNELLKGQVSLLNGYEHGHRIASRISLEGIYQVLEN